MNTITKNEKANVTPDKSRRPVAIIETPIFNFDDLDESAKENARNWWREGAMDYDWWNSTFEDAETIGLRIKSFEIDRGRHATGVFTKDVEEVFRLIGENHGKDCETFKTSTEYLHQYEKAQNQDELDEIEEEFRKALLEDYSIMLQHEYEYQLSDENADETIRINEYTFTETGKREG